MTRIRRLEYARASSHLENSLDRINALRAIETAEIKLVPKGDAYDERIARIKSLENIAGRLQECVDEMGGILQ